MINETSASGTLTYSFESDGIVFDIIITDLGDGRFAFDVSINLELSQQIGDIRAFYFDIDGDVDTMGLLVEDTSADNLVAGLYGVSLDDEYVIDEADVKSVESNDTNMNGEVKGSDLFDVGVEFGHQGMSGGDDYQSVSFVLSGAEELTLDDFNLQSIGVRLTSVGEIDGSRDGSLKISDQTDGEINLPPVAEDDSITILEDGAVGPGEATSLNILANDSDPDGDPLTITSIDGTAAPGEPISVTTANGVETSVTITETGDVVFLTDGAFDALGVGEFDSLTLDYTVSDGNGGEDSATVTINILGEDDPAVSDVSYNIMFMVDMSASALAGGTSGALFGADDAFDQNGDGLAATQVDAAFNTIRMFQDALAASGMAGDVDLGVGTFSYSDGYAEEYQFLTNDGQLAFGLDDDVSAAFGQAAAGGDTAFLGSPFAAANDFFAATGGADENVVNLFYIISDGALVIGSSDQVDDWVAEMYGTFTEYSPRVCWIWPTFSDCQGSRSLHLRAVEKGFQKNEALAIRRGGCPL